MVTPEFFDAMTDRVARAVVVRANGSVVTRAIKAATSNMLEL